MKPSKLHERTNSSQGGLDKPGEKKRQSKVVRVEFRAGGGLHGPDKPVKTSWKTLSSIKNENVERVS